LTIESEGTSSGHPRIKGVLTGPSGKIHHAKKHKPANIEEMRRLAGIDDVELRTRFAASRSGDFVRRR